MTRKPPTAWVNSRCNASFPGRCCRLRRDDARLAVRVGDWNLKSPIGLAAGFDKDGAAVPGLQHLGFDYLTVGSILIAPSGGNPRPRLLCYPETESMVNCYGLPSDGLEVCAARFKRLASRNLRTRLIANIHAESIADYVHLCAALAPYADGIELALRCPNRSDRLAIYPVAELDDLMGTLRRQWPDKAHIREAATIRQRPGKAQPARARRTCDPFRSDRRDDPGKLDRAGAAPVARAGLVERAVDLRRTTCKRCVQLPRSRKAGIAIKASGGVHTGADAFALLAAGATMIDILTAFVYRGWNAAAKIKAELSALMDERGIARVADLASSQHG